MILFQQTFNLFTFASNQWADVDKTARELQILFILVTEDRPLTPCPTGSVCFILEMDWRRVHRQPAHFASGSNHHSLSLCWTAGRVSCPQGAFHYPTKTGQYEHNGELEIPLLIDWSLDLIIKCILTYHLLQITKSTCEFICTFLILLHMICSVLILKLFSINTLHICVRSVLVFFSLV